MSDKPILDFTDSSNGMPVKAWKDGAGGAWIEFGDHFSNGKSAASISLDRLRTLVKALEEAEVRR